MVLKELENLKIFLRLATAVGGTGYGGFGDGLHAVSSHKEGPRVTPSSPSTPGGGCLLYLVLQSSFCGYGSLYGHSRDEIT